MCSALENITIPENVTTIGYYAFRSTALTNVTFGVTYGWSAGDNKIASNDIANSAALMLKKSAKVVWTRDINAQPDVDPYIISGICKNGTTKWGISLREDGKYKLTISGNGDMPRFYTGEAPWYNTEYALQIVEIVIEEGVTSIGRCSFYGLKNVSSVTMPKSVTTIGDYGFYYCKALATIDLTYVETVGTDAFVKTKVNQ